MILGTAQGGWGQVGQGCFWPGLHLYSSSLSPTGPSVGAGAVMIPLLG